MFSWQESTLTFEYFFCSSRSAAWERNLYVKKSVGVLLILKSFRSQSRINLLVITSTWPDVDNLSCSIYTFLLLCTFLLCWQCLWVIWFSCVCKRQSTLVSDNTLVNGSKLLENLGTLVGPCATRMREIKNKQSSVHET